jgi:hypothetical protein
MAPFYDRLPDVAGVGFGRRVDLIGAAAAVGAAAGVAAHAIATGVNRIRSRELPVVDRPPASKEGTRGQN